MIQHHLHYFPTYQENEHAPTEGCVCTPEAQDDGSYIHRVAYDFNWQYPCCGGTDKGRVFGGSQGPTGDALTTFIDALPHNCVG